MNRAVSAVKTSLPARMFNAVTDPVAVFEEVRDSAPSFWNWVAPFVLAAVAGLIFTVVAFSQPAVVDQVIQLQSDAIDQEVRKGALKAEEGQAAKDRIEAVKPMMAMIMMVFGGLSAVAGVFAFGFATAFVLWLLARSALKSPVDFWKAMEIVGMTQMVAVLNTVVSLMVVVYRGSITAGPNAALLMPDLKPGTALFTLLGAINPFMIWWVGLLALGLAILARGSWRVTAGWLFGLYVAIFLLLAGWASFRS